MINDLSLLLIFVIGTFYSVFILVHSIKARLTPKGYKASGGKLVELNSWNLQDKDLNPYTYEYLIPKK